MSSSHSPLPLAQRGELFTHLGAMEAAGLAPDKAFGLIKLRSGAQARVEKARDLLARGANPAVAGEKSGLFDKLEARLVRAALTAGSPAQVYRRLGEMHTKRAMQLKSMKAKLWLPAAMVLIGLAIGPLPQFILGRITLGGYLWQVLAPAALIAVAVKAIVTVPRWLRGTALEEPLGAFLPLVPWFGPAHLRRNARDFFQSLALMLEAGVPMFDALPPAVDTLTNSRLRRQYAALLPAMRRGATFTDALRNLRYLGDERVLSFAQTGEASGTLPEMLLRHVEMETDTLDRFYEQATAWAPRVVYALVAIWMAKGLLGGPGIKAELPPDVAPEVQREMKTD